MDQDEGSDIFVWHGAAIRSEEFADLPLAKSRVGDKQAQDEGAEQEQKKNAAVVAAAYASSAARSDAEVGCHFPPQQSHCV